MWKLFCSKYVSKRPERVFAICGVRGYRKIKWRDIDDAKIAFNELCTFVHSEKITRSLLTGRRMYHLFSDRINRNLYKSDKYKTDYRHRAKLFTGRDRYRSDYQHLLLSCCEREIVNFSSVNIAGTISGPLTGSGRIDFLIPTMLRLNYEPMVYGAEQAGQRS